MLRRLGTLRERLLVKPREGLVAIALLMVRVGLCQRWSDVLYCRRLFRPLAPLRERLLERPRAGLDGLALLLLRVSVGVVFAQTGWGKLHHLDDIIEFFRGLGIPAPQLQA